MQLNKYFIAQEFICEEEYDKLMLLPENMRLNAFFKLVDKRIINAVLYIRNKLGLPVEVNTWHKGGDKQWRGHRTEKCDIGAEFSMHKKTPCQAVDFRVKGMADDDVKKFIIEHQKELYALGIRRMEHKDDAPTWQHIDTKAVRNYKDKIYVFRK